MLRSVFILVFSVFMLTPPLAAQAPEGWRVRIDRSENASDPDDVPDLKVATMGKGFRATGGPAGTFWNPANRVTGNYTARATFNLMKPSGHVNYYGLVFGGSDLEGSAESTSTSWLPTNGTFIIRSTRREQVQDVRSGCSTPRSGSRAPTADYDEHTGSAGVQGTPFRTLSTAGVVHTTPQERRDCDRRRASSEFASITCRLAGGEIRGGETVAAPSAVLLFR